MADAVVRVRDERLWGLTVMTTAGIAVRFEPKEEDDGGAGVREPRRPKTPLPVQAAAVDVPVST